MNETVARPWPAELESRLRILLPETYEVFDRAVQPRSMGSAGLKYGLDGKVRWDEMWASFCDLAMAGGPPHRGKLLSPGRTTVVSEERRAQEHAASAEICRGLWLVTGLCAEQSPVEGWLRLYCTSATMAGWLARATTMENVSAVAQGLALYLPIGADFRVEKEIKNVITSVAKGCHYWQDHMTDAKHDAIADLLARMNREAPLLQPRLMASAANEDLTRSILSEIQGQAYFAGVEHSDSSWAGLECQSVQAAVWVMRALVAENFVARREETVVFFPVNSEVDPTGRRTLATTAKVYQLARTFGMFEPTGCSRA